MKILITGCSGLIGSALKRKLEKSHQVMPLERNKETVDKPWWNIEKQQIHFNGFDPEVIIHLAGENIAAKRWSEKQKQIIFESRIKSTRLLTEHLLECSNRPSLVISASAIGYYGHRPGQKLTEKDTPGTDFVSKLSVQWERETDPLKSNETRVVNMRTGLVLSKDGGALEKMLTPFKLGLGGTIGSGQQYYSWISLEDVVSSVEHIINNTNIQGPINLTAPKPATNREFTKALGQALGRPTLLPMPAFMARLVFGEMADELLLASTRVVPNKLLDSGYVFKHSNINNALSHILGS